MEDRNRYPIKLAAEMSGVTQFVIRSWEKRNNAVQPVRTNTNRRLYSDADIERLILLRQATQRGHAIGTIAALSNAELAGLLSRERTVSDRTIGNGSVKSSPVHAAPQIGDLLDAARALDVHVLDGLLTRASIHLSPPELITDLIVPFLEAVGRLWQIGELRVSHEHMATAALRTFLGNLVAASPRFENAPTAVVCTPVNQVHELGALIVAASITTRGWNVVYLGGNLPSEEIALTVRQLGSRLLILSIVYPADDPMLHKDLMKLATMLPEGTTVAAGGRAASAYGPVLRKMEAVIVHDLHSMDLFLASQSAAPLVSQ